LAVAVVAMTGVVGSRFSDGVTNAPVVGPEVVTPVGDAVGLVDDEQAEPGRRRAGHRGEPEVVEALGADAQQVELTRRQTLLDVEPVVGVGGVDGRRTDPHSFGRSNLVAHQQ
jgi:hypothetical protein